MKHYGLPLADLELTRAHRKVEGAHRTAAWAALLDHASEEARPRVVFAMEQILDAWFQYRDAVAEACGLARGDALR